MSTSPTELRIGLLGFGEVGQRFGADLRARGVQRLAAYDLLLDHPEDSAAMRAHAERHGIELVASTQALVERADLVICAVTAAQTLNAAQAAARAPMDDRWFIDVNSASPGTKSECSRLVSAAGGRYVESAVMTSVPPYGFKVPMLLGGPHASALAPILTALGGNAKVVSPEIGVASAIKLCRSVIIKGIEALVIESFTAARAFGVEEHVLASLAETYPTLDWEQQGDYYFSRVIQHGKRRAEEMQASAETVASRGIEGTMAEAAARRQAYVAAHRAAGGFADPLDVKPWRERADELLRGK